MDDQNQPPINPTNPEIAGPPTPEPMTAGGDKPEVVFGDQQPAEAPAATDTDSPITDIPATGTEPQTTESTFGTINPTEPAPSDNTFSASPETTGPATTSNTFSGPVDSSTNFNAETPSEPAQAPTFAAAPEKPKKKSNTSSILMLLMFIVTLCGVGFGVYGMFFAPGKEVEKVVYQTVEKEVTVASEENSVYIGEWGLKIKLPETIDASHVSYQYQGEKESGLGYSVVKFWGQPNTATAVASYADPMQNTIGIAEIYLVPDDYSCEASCPSIVELEDGQKIAVSHPQDSLGISEADEQEASEASRILLTALRDSENYSAF